MPHIHIKTVIEAPIERCFDLMRSVEVHTETMNNYDEEAVKGRTSGLFETGDTVVWKARHFGFYQRLQVRIVQCDFPSYFLDEQVSGTFKSFRHEHRLFNEDGVTVMLDDFVYRAPLGPIGKLADLLFLEKYMQDLLESRADIIKRIAESAEWRNYLS